MCPVSKRQNLKNDWPKVLILPEVPPKNFFRAPGEIKTRPSPWWLRGSRQVGSEPQTTGSQSWPQGVWDWHLFTDDKDTRGMMGQGAEGSLLLLSSTYLFWLGIWSLETGKLRQQAASHYKRKTGYSNSGDRRAQRETNAKLTKGNGATSRIRSLRLLFLLKAERSYIRSYTTCNNLSMSCNISTQEPWRSWKPARFPKKDSRLQH